MNFQRLIFCATSVWIVIFYLSTPASGEEQSQLVVMGAGLPGSVASITFAANGQTLATGSTDNTVRLWEVATGALIRNLEGHSGAVYSVAFSADGRTLASGSGDHSVKLWEVETGKLIRTLKGHSSWVTSVAFSANGETLVSGSGDHAVKQWEVGTGKLIRTFDGHSDSVTSVAFSTGGQIFASGSADQTVRLWAVRTGRFIQTLKGHSDRVTSLAFSADNRTLASGSWDNSVILWQVENGKLIRTLKGHQGGVTCVTFSAGGRVLASGSLDNTVKLWEVETGKLISTLSGPKSIVSSVAFSPNGNFLVSATSSDSSLNFWNVEEQLVDRPQLHWVEPFSNTISSEVQLTLAYQGPANLQKLFLFLNGQPLSIEAQGKKLIEIPLSLSERKNVLYAVALDSKGSSSAPLLVQFEFFGAIPGPIAGAPSAAELEVEISGGMPPELVAARELEVNKRKVRVEVDPSQQKLRFLGDSSYLEAGVNWIKTLKGDFRFWWEEQKLTRMPSPYESSYAVIAAIDEYEEKKMGFERLDAMVARAQELVNVLVKVGFPRENIITLYDRAATSANIKRQLERFWKGGDQSSADRLFFYFGGHGTGADGPGYLITSDYDPKKPGLTSFLMSDIVSSHFPNVQAKHMIVAIDACSSGLSIPGMRNLDGVSEERLRNFRNLAVVMGDTKEKARNLLVAGTGEEKALYINGGIFTRALIDGLSGAGDWNKDGIIQFDELALQLRNEVRAKAAQTAVAQEPMHFVGSAYGNGKVLFLTPEGPP